MIEESLHDVKRRNTALEAANAFLLNELSVAQDVTDLALGSEDRAKRRASGARRRAIVYRTRWQEARIALTDALEDNDNLRGILERVYREMGDDRS